jgi:integrative and conjugative element protein (TIGR02256 family)
LASHEEPRSNPAPSDRSFHSTDRRYGLVLGCEQLAKILEICSASDHLETGGILVGSYNEAHDLAIVSDVSGPPPDSKRGPTWFFRGVRGLQTWIERLWKGKCYYLGEWHFHPGARPDPSGTDKSQIHDISRSAGYHCPEPLLVIIGGSVTENWEIAAFVAPRNAPLTVLQECRANSGAFSRRLVG